MTAIAIWRNDETGGNPSLWAVADSLVSSARGEQLIGDAVKIFSLPIISRRPGPEGFFNEPYFAHTLGYCFAGSTLMGQNTYLGLIPLLSGLISPDSYIPSMGDVAQQALAYLKRTFDDYKAVAAFNSMFEVAIFGYCPRNQRLEIFHFRPAAVGGVFEMTLNPHQDLGVHDFVYLGDERDAMEVKIASAFAAPGIPGRPMTRAPRYVIEDCIGDENSKTIGGGIQLAIADQFGLRPLATVRPYEPGNPAAFTSYLGRELTHDLMMVGKASAWPQAIC